MASKLRYGKDVKGYTVEGHHFKDLVSARKYAAKQCAISYNQDKAAITYIGYLVQASNGFESGLGEHPTRFGWVKITSLGKSWDKGYDPMKDDVFVWRAPNKKDSRIINPRTGEVVRKLTTKEMYYL